MSHQHVLQGGITVVLAILFLVGCTGNAPISLSAASAATAAPKQPTTTPTLEPSTPTPEPATATPTPEPAPTTEAVAAVDALTVGNPERGREIFENGGEKYTDKPQYHCIRCHSLDGSEGYGPSLQGISEQAGDRVPGQSAVEYLRQSILEPDAYILEGYPEKMGRIHRVLLNEGEINDLIAFMLTQ